MFVWQRTEGYKCMLARNVKVQVDTYFTVGPWKKMFEFFYVYGILL